MNPRRGIGLALFAPVRWQMALLGLVGPLLFAAVTSAQASLPPEDVQRMADRLADGVPDQRSVRIAVLPVADGTPPYAIRSIDSVTAQLRDALRSAPDARTFQFVEQEAIGRAAATLGLALPVGSSGALLIGVVVDADYVIVGSFGRMGEGWGRLDAELFDVDERRRLRGARADMSVSLPRTVAAGGAATKSPAPAPAPPPPTRVSPSVPPSVPAAFPRSSPSTGRRLAIVAALAATGASAGMAYLQDRELAASRTRLLAIPAGDTNSWDREFAHARHVERLRQTWLVAAIASAGAGAAVALIGPPDPRADVTLALPLSSRWTLNIAPAGRLFVVTTF